jgi:hypothetical protein
MSDLAPTIIQLNPLRFAGSASREISTIFQESRGVMITHPMRQSDLHIQISIYQENRISNARYCFIFSAICYGVSGGCFYGVSKVFYEKNPDILSTTIFSILTITTYCLALVSLFIGRNFADEIEPWDRHRVRLL